MEQLTHQNARTLLQSAADAALAPEKLTALNAHLASCPDCQGYAGQLTQLENDLRRLTHQHWDAPRPSLNIAAIKKQAARGPNRFVFSGQFAMATLILLTFFVAFGLLGKLPGNLTFGVAPQPLPGIPSLTATPSAQPATATLYPSMTQTCQMVIYIVQPDDTLEGIAARFGVPKQSIMEDNPGIETLSPGLKLTVPVCSAPPSGTMTPTNTSTPIN